jgi:hypothetical protein
VSTLVSINLAHPEGWNALQQTQTWCHWLKVTLSIWTCWRIPLSCWTCFSNLANLCAVEHYRLLLFAAGLVGMLCWSNSMCQSWSSIDFLSQSTMQQSVQDWLSLKKFRTVHAMHKHTAKIYSWFGQPQLLHYILQRPLWTLWPKDTIPPQKVSFLHSSKYWGQL